MKYEGTMDSKSNDNRNGYITERLRSRKSVSKHVYNLRDRTIPFGPVKRERFNFEDPEPRPIRFANIYTIYCCNINLSHFFATRFLCNLWKCQKVNIGVGTISGGSQPETREPNTIRQRLAPNSRGTVSQLKPNNHLGVTHYARAPPERIIPCCAVDRSV